MCQLRTSSCLRSTMKFSRTTCTEYITNTPCFIMHAFLSQKVCIVKSIPRSLVPLLITIPLLPALSTSPLHSPRLEICKQSEFTDEASLLPHRSFQKYNYGINPLHSLLSILVPVQVSKKLGKALDYEFLFRPPHQYSMS